MKNHLTRLLGLLLIVVGCARSEPDLDATRSELVEGQGQDWNGQDWNGQDWNGTEYDDTSWTGTALSNVTLGTATYSATISETVLSIWRYHSPTKTSRGYREQRYPNRICLWYDGDLLPVCTHVKLEISPSPLAGTRWRGTFVRPDGTSFEAMVQIGKSTTDLMAVRADTSRAMFALAGHASAAACSLEACDNPAGCRANCDLWQYDIRVLDVLDASGQPRSVCSPGHIATALSGTWNSSGTHVSSSTSFTFGCTSGVIAKCLRWGYRPYGSARRTGESNLTNLAPYHQTCVRAAAADYCGNGQSFTKNGTLVDIFDSGFVPRTSSVFPDTTAYVWESYFNTGGARMIDYLRYEEESDIEDPERGCPGAFMPLTDEIDLIDCASQLSQNCLGRVNAGGGPSIVIASSTGCAHSEQTVGKWLHGSCSPCTRHLSSSGLSQTIPVHCTDPTDARGWNESCVQAAQAACGTQHEMMAVHSECTTGLALSSRDTGCTASVCRASETAHCCDPGGWDASCVSAANATCRGGLESTGDAVGFCGSPL